ncbi:uncharacterized protein [Diadema antillarum]|uniref:uncharacterized protein n=1 Tax=Diadema antillarum TaxID=105358 RepID=UPI003A884064
MNGLKPYRSSKSRPRMSGDVAGDTNDSPAPDIITSIEFAESDISDSLSDIQPTVAQRISLPRTYFLCITLGFFGAHYYYLGRRTDGMLYTVTLGFFCIGWVVDWFRVPSLVEKERQARRERAENGYSLFAAPYGELRERSVLSAYLYCIPPWGFFGMHHMYLGTFRNNEIFHLIYTATLGFGGLGWLFDLFRIPELVRRANDDIEALRSGKPISSDTADTLHLDTAYMLAFPLGVFGLHHFYMRRHFYGIVYLCTLGLAGVGVLIDLVRLPRLFRHNQTCMKEVKTTVFRLDDAFILWFPLGILGLHQFYLRRWKMGVVYFFTFGFLGVGWLLDAFRMRSLVEDSNKTRDSDLLWQHVFTKRETVHANTNIFVPKELYKYPITDEDGNIQVYAFPLTPNGKPSWLLGWAWSVKQTSQNGFVASSERDESPVHREPLIDESPTGDTQSRMHSADVYEISFVAT